MMGTHEAGPVLVVQLMGGLGNQLFQYALGRRLALANSAQLILDATGYGDDTTPDAEMGIRICGLNHFRIVGTIVQVRESGPAGRIPIRRWIRKARRAGNRLLDQAKPYYLREEIVEPVEMRCRYDPRVQKRTFRGTLWVRGFWQSERYFLDIEDKIRGELMLRDEPSGKNAELAARISSAESVAIHVRHGDNANAVAAELGVLPRAYYEGAIRQLRQEVKEPAFVVFSDDVAFARQQLGTEDAFTFVDHNDAANSHEDLRLMSLCNHHVLANSTFGWWGAWLAKHPGQVVIAPRRYYLEADRPNPDLYPPTWRLV